ncbi:MAG: putative oxidoreductase [Aeromicrobium sp.]|jgi:predicted ferric reductase|nr:putative oxidoreductase [Aeromicrobium sp.]
MNTSTTTAPPAQHPRIPTRSVSGQRARRDGRLRLAAGSALWLSLLLVTYWWVADGGIQDLGGWESGLTSLGRLLGLVASDLLLVQVLLMARLPFLERPFGQDRLARQHRIVGFTSFDLMVAHIVLITWGYAAGQITQFPATIWSLTTDYPGMLLAAAGTVCLVMVVVSSIKTARRRVRYESWHLIHLYAYLGVGLALPHQLWSGQEFMSSTGATIFWWSAWAATAVAVIVWRVAVPLWRSARHGLRVSAVVAEAPGVTSVHLEGRHLDRLRVEAGQFFSWRFLDREGWTRAHPYSLSAAPDGSSLRVTIKALGDDSDRMPALAVGTRVMVEGPYGRLAPRARSRAKVALIGAGVGVTPLRALADGLDYAPGDAVMLQRYTEHPLFVRELQALTERRGLQLLWLPGRRRSPDSWLGQGVGSASDVDALKFWIPDLADRDVYVCGPAVWAESVRRTALAAGLPPEQFHLEIFQW